MSSDNKVNVDVKLGVNKFYVDEGHPHIILTPRAAWNAGPAGFSAAILFSKNGNTRRERSALSFATADALKHRITTLRRLIRLAPGDYVICINREQVNECYINV